MFQHLVLVGAIGAIAAPVGVEGSYQNTRSSGSSTTTAASESGGSEHRFPAQSMTATLTLVRYAVILASTCSAKEPRGGTLRG